MSFVMSVMRSSLCLMVGVLCTIFVGRAQEAVTHRALLMQIARDMVDRHFDMHVGIQAVSLRDGTELCSVNGHRRFTPASTTKLFTAVLALEQLGPAYRFETVMATDGTVDQSTLNGSLYLKASGDPSLREEDLARLVGQLQERGITTIVGDICVDTMAFEGDLFQPGSFIDNIGYGWNPPTTALSVNGKAAFLGQLQGGAVVSVEKLNAVSCDAGLLLQQICDQHGIVVQGAAKSRATPEGAMILAEHRSQSVGELLQVMLKQSNNLYADALFKKVGEVTSGTVGSWATGGAALKALLGKIGISPQDIVMVDGSGRSRYNLITPAHLVILMQWAHQQPYFPVLFQSLSIAGIDGTLKERMKDLAYCVHGKTGTLSGVSALAGYAVLPDDLVAFAILENGFVGTSVYAPACKRDVEDAFCYQLVEGSRDPQPA